MVNRQLATRIVDFLNELIAIDPTAVALLLLNRVPCNSDLADHPTVQVDALPSGTGYRVGLLGILNGLCGTDNRGLGAVAVEIDKDTIKVRRAFLLEDRMPASDDIDESAS